jgi:glycosyltransferase involved in cell wall biosynthesis
MLPKIAKGLSLPVRSINGWLTGMSEELIKQEKISFAVSFPVSDQAKPLEGNVDGVEYYAFPWIKKEFAYSQSTEDYLFSVLKKTVPDVIHIFGTEFPHTLAMVRACERAALVNRVVIHIQGLTSVYAQHFFAALPEKVIHSYSFRDIIKRDNIFHAYRKYQKRGLFETEALQKVSHVFGRTDWDRACTEIIHPDIIYHTCNETLRRTFYEHAWSLQNCERHSIFVSQWDYPIKGFHLLLKALPDLLRRYPDLMVYTTGKNPCEKKGIKNRLKQNYYLIYIRKLIEAYDLKKHIVFLGKELDEQSMCSAFLRAHVFLSPSSIENSPNSLGEAMLLGVPCVSSDVGGVKNMLEHGAEGFIYPYEEFYMITHYISRIFDNDTLALQFSVAARKHAKKTHNPEKNLKDLMQAYKEICSTS